MKRDKPVCEEIRPWLRDNLGKGALAALTGTDSRALDAAVHIIALYNYCYSKDEGPLLLALRAVVMAMQPQCREFVYHAIAHQMEWNARERLWALANLPVIEKPMICIYEPGGARRLAAAGVTVEN